MSNTIINWRFWHWHFQVLRLSDWGWTIRDRRSPVLLFPNDWHRGRGSVRYPESLGGQQNPEWKRIEFYDGGAYAIALALLLVLIIWSIAA